MDQGPLVEFQRDDGQVLLNRLVEEGVPVTAACWLKESVHGEWYLYIATPLVPEEGGGKRQAYGVINAVRRQMPESSGANELEIKVISPGNPIARTVLELHRRYPGRSSIPFRGDRIGDLSIEGAYVYPPISAPATK